MPTALLTGANGFTGRLLASELHTRGFHVVALRSDITDKQALTQEVQAHRPDWVIHLAALTFVADTDAEAFYRVNVIGTLNLLEALATLNPLPQRVLIASSANIYGIPNSELIDEQTPPAPVNHYACSKLVMEHLVSPWFDRLPIVIPRPFNYTGPGQDERFLIPKIVNHFVRRAPCIELGNLDISRDFSDVRDVIAAYLALLASDVRGVKVNICSGRALSLHAIIEHMNQLAGYAIDVRVNPAFVRTNEIPTLRGSHHLLAQLVGYTPAIPFTDTLASMYYAGLAKCS